MKKCSQTYRTAAALMSLVLMLSVALPVVQHVCMMDRDRAMAHHQAAHCDADAPQGHSFTAFTAREGARSGAHDASRQDCTCCLLEAPDSSQALLLVDRLPEHLAAPVAQALVAAALAPAYSSSSVPVSAQASLPPPAALHVLHATFLN